jgi:centromeric protein E
MDVRNVDPEDAVVDFQTLDPGDVSMDFDESFAHDNVTDHGSKDKVLVSIRYVVNNTLLNAY